MVLGTCHLQGRQPPPWQVTCEFRVDQPNFIFQPVVPDVIWHIYSGLRCLQGVLGMDLLSSGNVALSMGQVPCEFWAYWWNFIFQQAAPDVIWHIYSGQCCYTGDGAIHLPSSGEVLLGLGKVPCESGKDHTKHWGSYPWDVCQGPRPLKSESGRMEWLNVVSSYVCISALLSKPLFH